MNERLTQPEMEARAARAVHKVDLLGLTGTEQCTREEVEAMAALIVAAGILPPSTPRFKPVPNPVFKSVRKTQ
ncbi:hypothetical protein K3727_09585 [Rhodobacteraceae bacterium M382]|nr:hypothetical protein K3727_09585 [Rhodobacteraceae bacterium M382]